MVLHHLDETGLTGYFDVIIGGDMVEHSKPFPDIYLKACKEFKCNPHDTYAVEDSYNGIESAVKAGLKTIMIPDSLPPVKEYDSKIFTRFDSLVELSEYFAIRALMEKLWQKYDYASILFENSTGRKYSVSGRGLSASQDKISCARGYVLRVHGRNRLVEHSFNSLKVGDSEKIIAQIENLFDKAEELKENFTIEDTERMEDEVFHSFSENDMSRSPEILGDKAILDKLTELRQKGLEADGQIIDCTINSSFKRVEKFLSPKTGICPRIFYG